jgi:hypothetical protein
MYSLYNLGYLFLIVVNKYTYVEYNFVEQLILPFFEL